MMTVEPEADFDTFTERPAAALRNTVADTPSMADEERTLRSTAALRTEAVCRWRLLAASDFT